MQGSGTQSSPIRGNNLSESKFDSSSHYFFSQASQGPTARVLAAGLAGRIGKSGIARISNLDFKLPSERCKFHSTDSTLPPSGGQGARKNRNKSLLLETVVLLGNFLVRSWVISALADNQFAGDHWPARDGNKTK